MKSAILSLLLTGIIGGTASAQMKQGNIRISPSFSFSSFEDNTNAEFNMFLGYSFLDHLEMGGNFGVTKLEGIDTYGFVAVGGAFHIAPDLRMVPGIGGAFGSTFGRDINSLYADVFFSFDAFVNDSWSFRLMTGYQRWDNELGDGYGFKIRFGVSTFLNTAKRSPGKGEE